MNDSNNIEVHFQYASIQLQAYSSSSSSSSRLLKDIVNKLNDPNFPPEERIIDRSKNQKDSVSRRLVQISSPISNKGKTVHGRIALIKNKAPKLWGGKNLEVDIEKEEKKQFIEITNYCINFNEDSDPIIMFEFNSDGPRLLDIVFYFRQISKLYSISKAIKPIIHLNSEYSDLEANLSNVFSVVVKLDASKLNKSSNVDWHKSLVNLNEDSGYEDVRLELFYKRKKKLGKYIKNVRGLDFAKNILSWLKSNNKNIEYVEDLKMSFQLNEEDEPIELDFLKNKRTSILLIPLFNKTQYSRKEYKSRVILELNHYLKTGETNDYSLKKKI